MKKLLLAPALAALLLTSCKDDPKLEAPEINSINFSKARVAIGQLITITPDVTDKDTDNANLFYRWQSTDGFSSEEREAQWVPASKGEQVITLTVDDGTTRTTDEATKEVLEPDFRLGLWGDTQEAITRSEKHAGHELEIISLGPGVNAVALMGTGNSVDAYYIQDNIFVQAQTFFLDEYSTSEYNQYFTNFNSERERLTTKYGASVNTETEWANPEAEEMYANNPEQWGQALAEGALISHAVVWIANSTGIILYIERDETEGEIFSGIVYVNIEDGRMANTKNKGSMLSGFKNYPKEIKNSTLIKK